MCCRDTLTSSCFRSRTVLLANPHNCRRIVGASFNSGRLRSNNIWRTTGPVRVVPICRRMWHVAPDSGSGPATHVAAAATSSVLERGDGGGLNKSGCKVHIGSSPACSPRPSSPTIHFSSPFFATRATNACCSPASNTSPLGGGGGASETQRSVYKK